MLDKIHTFIEVWESVYPNTIKKVMSNGDKLLLTLGNNAKSRYQLLGVLEAAPNVNIQTLAMGTYLVTNE